MAERGLQLRHSESNCLIHERAENVICEGEDGGCRGRAQRRGTLSDEVSTLIVPGFETIPM